MNVTVSIAYVGLADMDYGYSCMKYLSRTGEVGSDEISDNPAFGHHETTGCFEMVIYVGTYIF